LKPRYLLIASVFLGVSLRWVSRPAPNQRPYQSSEAAPVAARVFKFKPSLLQTSQPGEHSPSPTDSLSAWIRNETLQVGRTDLNPDATRADLETKAKKLSKLELLQLKNLALDEQQTGDTKFLSVYLLGLSDSALAVASLKDIGLAPIHTNQNERQVSDSTVVRLYALDALVKRLPAKETTEYLRGLLTTPVVPPVAKHAEHLLSHL